MERINLRKEQIYKFVNVAFEAMGYNDLERIDLHFLDMHEPLYSVYFNDVYNGERVKILKELSLANMVKVIRLGMELSGYYILDLQPRIKEECVSYVAKVNVVSNGRKLSKRK